MPRYRHSAVDRNRLKRRLRELVRLHLLPLGLPADIVIWAQRDAYAASFDALRAALTGTVPRLERHLRLEH